MDQLAEMRVFVRAIERGTFAVAASDLGLTPSAVSKLVGRLEARLGVRLVNRTTRKLALTAEGETYFQSGRRLIEAVDGLEHEVAASAGRPRGVLRINTAVSFGVQHLAPALIEFHQRYPDVRDQPVAHGPARRSACRADRRRRAHGPARGLEPRVAQVRRGRAGHLREPGLSRRVRRAREPGGPRAHRCIVFTAPGRGRWPFRTADGGLEQAEVPPTFATDSLECILQLALQGAGIARLPDFMVARPIRAGTLVPLLATQHYPERTPALAVLPAGRAEDARRSPCSSISSTSASDARPGSSARVDAPCAGATRSTIQGRTRRMDRRG